MRIASLTAIAVAATLGAGGAICGMSGSIAIAGAVGARKQDAPIAITLVIFWAIIMIFVLPLVSKALGLPTDFSARLPIDLRSTALPDSADHIGDLRGMSARVESRRVAGGALIIRLRGTFGDVQAVRTYRLLVVPRHIHGQYRVAGLRDVHPTHAAGVAAHRPCLALAEPRRLT